VLKGFTPKKETHHSKEKEFWDFTQHRESRVLTEKPSRLGSKEPSGNTVLINTVQAE